MSQIFILKKGFFDYLLIYLVRFKMYKTQVIKIQNLIHKQVFMVLFV